MKTKKDVSFLKRIAGLTRGSYIDISDSFSGLSFINEIVADQHRNKYGSRIIREPREQYQVFAFILLVVLSIELMLPERRSTGQTGLGGFGEFAKTAFGAVRRLLRRG